MPIIRILLNGCRGHMGAAVAAAVAARGERFAIVAGADACAQIGSPALPFPAYASLSDAPEEADLIVDFSVAAALPDVLACAVVRKLPVIVATTALTERHEALLDEAATHIPVFQSGNLSLGVNLQLALVRSACRALCPGFDVEIVERHHNRKLDAPSGTALMLANAVAAESADPLTYVYGRSEKDQRRAKNELGIHSVRGGTLVGEHEVSFIGTDEVIEITHRAYSKQVFAQGALRAAEFLIGQPAGRYNMQDLFGSL